MRWRASWISLRTGELEPTTDVINVLFRAVDTLELLLDQTINDEMISPYGEQMAALKALVDSPRSVVTQTKDERMFSAELNEFNRETIKQGIAQGYYAFAVSVVLKPNTILKSVRVFTVFQALEEVATIVQSNPSAEDLDDEKFDRQFALVVLTKESEQNIRQIVEGISEIESVLVEEVSLDDRPEAGPQNASEIAAAMDVSVSATPVRTSLHDPLYGWKQSGWTS